MGFHICEYRCTLADEGKYSRMSSGDVTLGFSTGNVWTMPDMVLHYVDRHGFLPPQQFVADVMGATYVEGFRLQTKSVTVHERVGYLSGPYPMGRVPTGFLEKLEALMKQAAGDGNRRQTRMAIQL